MKYDIYINNLYEKYKLTEDYCDKILQVCKRLEKHGLTPNQVKRTVTDLVRNFGIRSFY